MLSPRKIARNHEDVFIEHYQWLLSWALRLAEGDRALAEDLVQDAFVHFTLARPDLRSIHNLEGYLYSMLRNLHLSQQRRATRNRLQQLSVFEYDTIEAGLMRVGCSVERLQVQDELRRVCHYASLRKETARAASLLILRFFHGYYPSEIAQIARTNRRAVDERLRIARNEARLYITDPGRLKFINDASFNQPPVARDVRARDEFLTELREMIFRSRHGACLSRERLEGIYKSDNESQISGQYLAHIVSCPDCLDRVNRLLNLPNLNDRHPTDTLGKDSTGGAGGRTGANSGGDGAGSGGTSDLLQKYRRSAREIFEHRPQELYFLINGFILGSQTINSEWSEQTLDINLSERIAFVEVFSERDTRLHFFPVEPPPEGEAKQPTRVELSDGRSLDLTLSFNNAWPTLHAVYHDPLMTYAHATDEEQALEEARAFHETNDENHAQAETVAGGFQESGFLKTGRRLASFLSGARGFWLRPGLITALLAIVLVSMLVLVKMRAPVEGAAELLRLSAAAEAKLAANADIVLHRKMSFEERRGGTKELVASYRLDVWQSAARELTVRRVYDAEGNLVAGEWTRTDGASIVYSHASSPQQRTAPGLVSKAILETGEIWRLDASAASFGALCERVDAIKVEERGGVYVLSYEADAANGKQALRNATLTLRKGDLRAIGQTLTVERDGEVREYRFGEELFERFPKAHVGHTVFQPEPVLLGPKGETKEGSNLPQSQADGGSSTSSALESASLTASRELEIEVSYLLNRVRADLGEQIALTRTAGGQLRVEALVETERRKEEILRALGPVLNNRAVSVRVSTIDEALSRNTNRRGQSDVTEREVEIQTTRIPADAELRRYFNAAGGAAADVDEKINQFANRMLSRSRQARAHASQLQRLAGRFSPEEIRSLAPEARTKWLSMIRGHAEGLRRELALMRQDLRAVFAPNAGADATRETITEANLVQATARLARLSSNVDEAVRSAFTLSADGRTAAAIRNKEFWHTLATAEGLAASIQDVYR